MPRIGTLISLLALGRAANETVMFRKFLSSAAAVLALTVVSAMMIGALLLSAFYVGYLALAASGLTTLVAALITAGVGLAVTAALIYCTISYLRTLMNLPNVFSNYNEPVTARVATIAESFLDGLLQRTNHAADAVRNKAETVSAKAKARRAA